MLRWSLPADVAPPRLPTIQGEPGHRVAALLEARTRGAGHNPRGLVVDHDERRERLIVVAVGPDARRVAAALELLEEDGCG